MCIILVSMDSQDLGEYKCSVSNTVTVLMPEQTVMNENNLSSCIHSGKRDSNDFMYRDATECIHQLFDYSCSRVDENITKHIDFRRIVSGGESIWLLGANTVLTRNALEVLFYWR